MNLKRRIAMGRKNVIGTKWAQARAKGKRMALLYTPPANESMRCPDFKLLSVDGKWLTLKDFASSRALVVMFICNHCPYVKAVEDRLLSLGRELQPKGAGFLAVCSNDATEYPEDAPKALFDRWKSKEYPFPYAIDEDQTFAKKLDAVCTPDLYVFDENRNLKYRGRLDDSWKNPEKVSKQELREAILAVLNGKSPSADQIPSMGCSIKWKEI